MTRVIKVGIDGESYTIVIERSRSGKYAAVVYQEVEVRSLAQEVKRDLTILWRSTASYDTFTSAAGAAMESIANDNALGQES